MTNCVRGFQSGEGARRIRPPPDGERENGLARMQSLSSQPMSLISACQRFLAGRWAVSRYRRRLRPRPSQWRCRGTTRSTTSGQPARGASPTPSPPGGRLRPVSCAGSAARRGPSPHERRPGDHGPDGSSQHSRRGELVADEGQHPRHCAIGGGFHGRGPLLVYLAGDARPALSASFGMPQSAQGVHRCQVSNDRKLLLDSTRLGSRPRAEVSVSSSSYRRFPTTRKQRARGFRPRPKTPMWRDTI